MEPPIDMVGPTRDARFGAGVGQEMAAISEPEREEWPNSPADTNRQKADARNKEAQRRMQEGAMPPGSKGNGGERRKWTDLADAQRLGFALHSVQIGQKCP